MRRHTFWIVLAVVMALTTAVRAAERAEIFKTSGCACCTGWIKHIEAAGYMVEAKNLPMGSLMKLKLDAGLKPDLTSCHSALIDGYFIEGHVPAREIARLLAEHPDAIGLTVPGMPLGSPGMEAGDDREAYDVLLVRKDGSTSVFAHYPR